MVKTDIKIFKRHGSGFTLLELLVVVGILAALVALALPFYQDYVNQSKLTAAQADLQTFKKALAMYDQLEPTMFTGANLLSLIGKYMQDYRTFSGQVNPVDPWGNDYFVNSAEGVFLSFGPNGTRETVDASLPGRVALGDDILVTWKPPYFVASARAVNQTTVEVTFSRKLAGSPVGTLAPVRTITNTQKVSETVFRFILNPTTPLAKGTSYTVTIAPVPAAQDGKATFDANPNGTDATGSKGTFVY